jgi:hypothetical protein
MKKYHLFVIFFSKHSKNQKIIVAFSYAFLFGSCSIGCLLQKKRVPFPKFLLRYFLESLVVCIYIVKRKTHTRKLFAFLDLGLYFKKFAFTKIKSHFSVVEPSLIFA